LASGQIAQENCALEAGEFASATPGGVSPRTVLPMVFGHNSNVTIDSEILHVQTEDRGALQALIDTTVHWKGRVLYRRTTNYQDLIPLEPGKEQTLKARVDDQHRAVVEELRSGTVKLTIPKQAPPAAASPNSGMAAVLKIDLTNPRTWLAGRNATLELLVRDSSGHPVANAAATARLEGAATPFRADAQTSDTGLATLQFEMPKLAGEEPALLIEAVHNGAKGQLRFQLRPKSKT
jgi:hypothetical protein